MQSSEVNKRHPLSFISQLPKERIVLDFVLSRLMVNSSPERFELIAAVFNLHLTSAGFDPMALSKARFKRVKASEFRQALREIDAEIALIIQTEDYRQVLTRQTYLPELFQQYLQLSADLKQSGKFTFKPLHAFAELLLEKDASDLMLGFIRQHKSILEKALTEDEIILLQKQMQVLIQDQHRSNTYAAAVLDLRLHELLALRGTRNADEIYRIWNYFTDQADSHQLPIQEKLGKILRCGLLTAWPCRNLKPWFSALENNIQTFYFNQIQQQYFLYLKLAEFHTEAEFETRLSWLNEAELISKNLNNSLLRSECKLTRARIFSDQGSLQDAVRNLDEAEYHILRVQDKDQDVRNVWIRIALTRIVVNSLSVLEEEAVYHPAIFEAQQFLLNDIGKFRSDIKLMVNEIHALNLFFQKNWKEAYDSFQASAEMRKDEENFQPMHAINAFFCKLLEPNSHSETHEKEIQRMDRTNEAWFGQSWMRIMKGALHYFDRSIHTAL